MCCGIRRMQVRVVWSDQNQWTSSYATWRPEHVPRGGGALLNRVLPVLHPDRRLKSG